MKRKKIFRLALACALPVFFLACNDDDGPDLTEKYIPSKIVVESKENSDKYVFSFNYDEYNRINTLDQIYYTGDTKTTEVSYKFVYKGNVQVDTLFKETKYLEPGIDPGYSLTDRKDTAVIEYSENKVTINWINIYYVLGNEPETPLPVYDEVELNGDGLISKFKLFSMESDYIYEYDTQKNISKFSGVLGDNEIVTSFDLTYDDKNGAFENIATPQWALISLLNDLINPTDHRFNFNFINNPVNYSGADISSVCTYEYNDQGYPITQEIEHNSSLSWNISDMKTSIEYTRAK